MDGQPESPRPGGRPYWLEGLGPLPRLTETLPPAVDVVVIGSGYTGLNAALETARGGRRTLVLEAGEPGGGCSTRNGGQISTSIKPSLTALSRRFGAERARAIREEGKAALAWIGDFVGREGISCDFRRCGRFHAAHSPRHYDELARTAEALTRDEGIAAHVVPRSDQHQELGTDLYHGGVVFPDHSSLHPGRYHRGLLERVLEAGAEVIARCPATALARKGDGFEVETPLGTVRARNVIAATNGYTSGLTPWLQRRAIPIGSYIIATEPLGTEVMQRLFPTGRVASDSRKVVYYFRPSPDGQRIVFGGRVAAAETDPQISAPLLQAELVRIFPELAGTTVTHSWLGFVAYSFDELAHTGEQDGIHYAMAYCGSGVSMASYLGMRLGQKVLGLREGVTAFDGLPFPTRPFYRGRPWFLPAAVAWHRWRDERAMQRAT